MVRLGEKWRFVQKHDWTIKISGNGPRQKFGKTSFCLDSPVSGEDGFTPSLS